jgi:acyl-CoA thioester hydrolase
MISSVSEIRVRYAETDRMGFAHHGNYMAWFELARVDMMDDLGYPYKQMEDEGFLLPVLEVSVRYRKPVTFDDLVTIEAVMKEKATLRMRIDYLLRCRGKITAEGFTRHAFINRAGQPVRPPSRFRDLMKKHFPTQPGEGASW